MEWTNELIFEFLNLYQNEPTLWNSAAPEHKNKADAYDAWNRIKNNLKDGTIPIKDIKKKRDNLMSTYRRQRTKVRESRGTGSGTDDVYKPEWPFYDIMAGFLDEIYKPKKTKSSEDPLDDEDTEAEEDNNTQATSEQTFKTPKTFGKYNSKKRRTNALDEMNTRSDEAYNILKQMTNTEPDTSSLYCNLLCSKLRSLQESTRDIAMMKIDEIMYALKQQDNHTRNFPNTAFQGYSHSSNSQPPLQCQVSLPSPGNSHSSNSQPSPQHEFSLPSPGYSHSSNSQPSPQHEFSLPYPGYSHSSNSQPPLQCQVSLPSPGYPHSSNSQPFPQYQVLASPPDDVHSSNIRVHTTSKLTVASFTLETILRKCNQ